MKKEYAAPEVEIIRFETEDVITASSVIDNGMTDGGSGSGGNTGWGDQ